MLGLVDKSWMIDLIDDGSAFDAHEVVEQERRDGEYAAYFGLGQSVRLLDRPRVFRLSPAGLALGAYLTKSFDDDLLRGRLLDLGTGSGALAILLRGLGGSTIVATDISRESVDAAAANELVNYSTPQIEFCTSDVFAGLGQEHGKFDAIVFNPPGWRTPSPEVRKRLQAADTDDDELDLSSMFYGDEVLLKFFYELPDHLHARGRAIVGMNSLIGIRDVIRRYKDGCGTAPGIRFKLVERHTFPLLLYTARWVSSREILLDEFQRWSEAGVAAFTMDRKGRIYWSYEIVECSIL